MASLPACACNFRGARCGDSRRRPVSETLAVRGCCFSHGQVCTHQRDGDRLEQLPADRVLELKHFRVVVAALEQRGDAEQHRVLHTAKGWVLTLVSPCQARQGGIDARLSSGTMTSEIRLRQAGCQAGKQCAKAARRTLGRSRPPAQGRLTVRGEIGGFPTDRVARASSSTITSPETPLRDWGAGGRGHLNVNVNVGECVCVRIRERERSCAKL